MPGDPIYPYRQRPLPFLPDDLMKATSGQFDLDPGYRETPRRIAPVRRGRQQANIAPGTEGALV